MQCSKEGLACAHMYVCVFGVGGGVLGNQCALLSNEGREGPPVLGRWAESSEMGFGDGECGEHLLDAESVSTVCRLVEGDACNCWHGCCFFVSTYFPYLVRSLSPAVVLRETVLRRALEGRFA